MVTEKREKKDFQISRRDFLCSTVAGGFFVFSGVIGRRLFRRSEGKADVFIAKAYNYEGDLSAPILEGIRALGIPGDEIKGKRILLKPNLVETRAGSQHINTHPALVRGAAEAFLRLGAASVIVAEGPGHCRDTLRILEESGLADVLAEDRIPFIDLNEDDFFVADNKGPFTRIKKLAFPVSLRQVDWIVSMPKLKTHHWVGITVSMKNLFGLMPGCFYGWPKNVLHHAGIEKSILDINLTVRPHFAIVDGIVGMEGDGPIMGSPRHAGCVMMGRNLLAVDATCSRIMGFNPQKIPYIAAASGRLGPIREKNIKQIGEPIDSVRTHFKLIDKIPVHQAILS